MDIPHLVSMRLLAADPALALDLIDASPAAKGASSTEALPAPAVVEVELPKSAAQQVGTFLGYRVGQSAPERCPENFASLQTSGSSQSLSSVSLTERTIGQPSPRPKTFLDVPDELLMYILYLAYLPKLQAITPALVCKQLRHIFRGLLNDPAIQIELDLTHLEGASRQKVQAALELLSQQTLFNPRAVVLLNLCRTRVTNDGLGLCLQAFPNLQEVNLNGCYSFNEIGIKHLTQCGQLSSLRLNGSRLPYEALKQLTVLTTLKALELCSYHQASTTELGALVAQLISLESLNLNDSRVDFTTTEAIRKLTQLRGLSLKDGMLEDFQMSFLKALTHLQALNLRSSPLTYAGISYVKDLKELEHLDLTNTLLRDEDLQLLSDLRKLRVLNLSHTLIRGKGLRYLHCFEGLETLYLKGCELKDPYLFNLYTATHLTELSLSRCGVKNSVIQTLQYLTQLRILNLKKAQINNEGLQQLKSLVHLTALNVNECELLDPDKKRMPTTSGRITDAGAALCLAGMLNLRVLKMNQCRITDKRFQWLKKYQHLITLSLNKSVVGYKELQAIATLSRLTVLRLEENPSIKDGGLQALSSLQRLQELRLTECLHITDRGMDKGLSQLTSLLILSLKQCTGLTDHCIDTILKFRRLHTLDLTEWAQLTDAGIAQLSALTALQALTLTGCQQVTDVSAAALHQLPNLTALDVRKCGVGKPVKHGIHLLA